MDSHTTSTLFSSSHRTLFAEDPSAAEMKEMVSALYALQAAFAPKSFPKAVVDGASIGIWEQLLTKLYSDDVLPDVAILAWKDDMNDDDVPGKMSAVVQSSQFCAFLEEEDEESEEESEDED